MTEQDARSLYSKLFSLNKFSRLLRMAAWQQDDFKSVEEFIEHLNKEYTSTVEAIENNTWYKTEKEAIQNLDIKAIMENGRGQYDPDYQVEMVDVFRKQG